jgi:trans-aconitate 2-methyltransferase
MTDSLRTDDAVGWDPAQYQRFETARDRAAQDLIARIPADLQPRQVWDLGCGAGSQAAQLKRRFPDAAVHGLDSSPEMLDRARSLDADVDWRQGDLRGWRPEGAVDIIFANASLHWLPDHAALLPRLAAALAPGGVLAVQMPMAWETRHHRLLRDVAAQGPWAGRLSAVEAIAPLLPAEAYYAALADRCAVDVWCTTYLHVLRGPDPVLEWMAGTALRPYLTALRHEDAMRRAFLSELAGRLSEAFPPGPDGATLLQFPRLFLMARRGAEASGR